MNSLDGKRLGIFNHYLFFNLCPNGGYEEWNKCIDSINVKKMAKDIHDMGAEYYCITIMQGTKYLLAPNKVYDSFCNDEAGLLTPKRDIIYELALELKYYNIDMYLYFTGDGPHEDYRIGSNFGFITNQKAVDKKFVNNWSKVLEEYALKYKELIKGYWIDGCYHWWGYTDELLDIYYHAIIKGNPNAEIAMNDGLDYSFVKYFSKQTFTAGEIGDFNVYPTTKWASDNCLNFVLVPLGIGIDKENPNGWYSRGCKRTKEEVLCYVKNCNKIGVPVTIDIHINSDGTFDNDQSELIKYVSRNL